MVHKAEQDDQRPQGGIQDQSCFLSLFDLPLGGKLLNLSVFWCLRLPYLVPPLNTSPHRGPGAHLREQGGQCLRKTPLQGWEGPASHLAWVLMKGTHLSLPCF